jgi:hypothetical protein
MFKEKNKGLCDGIISGIMVKILMSDDA